MIRKLKTKSMFTDPNKDRERRLNADSTGQEQPAYFPDEIINPRTETSNRVGEVIYPTTDRAGEIVRLSNELAKLRQGQLLSQQSFENGVIPSQLPMHDEVARKYNEVQMQQLDAMQEIVEAQKNAKLNETKAGNLNAAREVSRFNQERLVDYSKAGAKSIGFTTKYLAIGAGVSALWIAKFGLEIGKVGVEITKEGIKALKDIYKILFPGTEGNNNIN